MPSSTGGRALVNRRRVVAGCCAGAALAASPWPARAVPAFVATADEPHHHVIFDGADLRIMRVMIPPDAATGWHEHAHDFITTVLRGSKTRVETAGQGEPALDEMVTDSVSFAGYEDRPAIRRVTNMSPWLNHQLAFEILTHKPQGYGPAERAGAPVFQPVLVHPRVKGWRLKLAPGEVSPAVVQSGPGVRVILAGERMIDTPLRGTAGETDIRAGDAAFLPPDTRSIANAGNAPLDLIEFELL